MVELRKHPLPQIAGHNQKTMIRTCIYANCQGHGLAHFLKKSGQFESEIEVFQNHQLILKEVSPEALKASAAKCDVFIYQPTDVRHGELSSHFYLEQVIPKSARTISFPYLYNHGFFPLIECGGAYIGAEEMPKEYWKLPLLELMQLYDMNKVNFALLMRLLMCGAEQARRELACDVQLAPWIMSNRHLPLFLNFNHPSSYLFEKLAREVLRFSKGHEVDPIPIDRLNEAGLPCDLPYSAYVIREFEMVNITPHPDAHMTYRKWLEDAWKKRQ